MIYVMSDIHGQKRRFDSVMKQIKHRCTRGTNEIK